MKDVLKIATVKCLCNVNKTCVTVLTLSTGTDLCAYQVSYRYYFNNKCSFFCNKLAIKFGKSCIFFYEIEKNGHLCSIKKNRILFILNIFHAEYC